MSSRTEQLVIDAIRLTAQIATQHSFTFALDHSSQFKCTECGMEFGNSLSDARFRYEDHLVTLALEVLYSR